MSTSVKNSRLPELLDRAGEILMLGGLGAAEELAALNELVVQIPKEVTRYRVRKLSGVAKEAVREMQAALGAVSDEERGAALERLTARLDALQQGMMDKRNADAGGKREVVAAPDPDEGEQARVVESAGLAEESATAGGQAVSLELAQGAAAEAGGDQVAVKVDSAALDESLTCEFLTENAEVYLRIEALLEGCRTSPDAKSLGELRAVIHKLAGEAGVVGLTGLADVCTRILEAIDGWGRGSVAGLADALRMLPDWLKDWLQSYSLGIKPPDADVWAELLAKAESPAVSTLPEPVVEPVPVVVEEVKPVVTEVAAVTAEDAVVPSEPVAAVAAGGGATGVAASDVVIRIDVCDRDLAREFVVEAQEHMETADEALLKLERDPADEEAVGAVFRAFHTVKGIASFLNMHPIIELTHGAEDLLDRVRKGQLRFKAVVVEATFAALDTLKGMIAEVDKAASNGGVTGAFPTLPRILAKIRAALDHAQTEVEPEPTAEEPEVVSEAAEAPIVADAEPGGEEAGGQTVGQGAVQSSRNTVKVDAERLDQLLDVIGELVISESIVARNLMKVVDKSLQMERDIAHRTKIIDRLQDIGMSMRLVPLDGLFRKMTRLVRDVSCKVHKPVELEVSGRETELDRGMVEALNDPLVHILRNAVDHGLESTEEERLAAGKSRVGRVWLRAFHRGGNVHIEIEDDGRGLNLDRIEAKGRERGLIRDGETPTEPELLALIFEPGFSTAAKTTELSGRGVGLDVVRSVVLKMRGNVHVRSRFGKGTVFTIVLPLTTAIINGMAVKVGADTYILPVLSIVESFRPSKDQITQLFDVSESIRFRDGILPLLRLNRLLGAGNGQSDASDGIVIVAEESGRRMALLVDDLLGQQQTVIKSLGGGIKQVPGISGACILADGRPGLILDAGGLLQLANETRYGAQDGAAAGAGVADEAVELDGQDPARVSAGHGMEGGENGGGN